MYVSVCVSALTIDPSQVIVQFCIALMLEARVFLRLSEPTVRPLAGIGVPTI